MVSFNSRLKMKKWMAMKITGCRIQGGFLFADMIVVVMGGKIAWLSAEVVAL